MGDDGHEHADMKLGYSKMRDKYHETVWGDLGPLYSIEFTDVKDISKSLGARCSKVRWAAKSSVT